MGEGEIIDHGGGGGGGHGEGGHGEGGGGGGRPHEYYHPQTPDEIRIARQWHRLEQEKAKAGAQLGSLYAQADAWRKHAEGLGGLAQANIRTWRITAPGPYTGESYLRMRKIVAELSRLPPDHPRIAKIRLDNPDAYMYWQSRRTRGQGFRNVFWSLSLTGGLNAVARGWERFTQHFGPLGKLLNFPVKAVVGHITRLFGDVPTGPHGLVKPGGEGQFGVRELATANPAQLAYKMEEYKQLVAAANKELADANAGMAAIAGQHEWVHRLPHAGGH